MTIEGIELIVSLHLGAEQVCDGKCCLAKWCFWQGRKSRAGSRFKNQREVSFGNVKLNFKGAFFMKPFSVMSSKSGFF